MANAVLFLYEQRLQLSDHIISPLPPALQQLTIALLEPLFWLGGHVTGGVLGLIHTTSAVSEAAADLVSQAPMELLMLASLAGGILVGTTSLLLGQRLDQDKTNSQLLLEDLWGLPQLLQGWAFYGVLSAAYTRFSYNDVKVSFGESCIRSL